MTADSVVTELGPVLLLVPRTRTIPVVVFSSSREDRDLIASYELGVNSFVAKSLDFEEFQDAVQKLGRYWLELNQTPGWSGWPPSP